MQFFSQGQFQNPMVCRIAGLAYQKGFGGHFHNDNGIAALLEIPGLLIACPSRGDDAVRMLRTLVAAAEHHGRASIFLEPIALYMTKDLHEPGDGAWATPYPPPGQAAAFGEGRVDLVGEGSDLTIVTYANGVFLSLRAAKRLYEEHGVRARVVDLMWLAPLDEELILEFVDLEDAGTEVESNCRGDNNMRAGPDFVKPILDLALAQRIASVDADVVHAHNYEAPIAAALARLRTHTPIPYNAFESR